MTGWKPGDRFTIEFELAAEIGDDSAAYRFKTTDVIYLSSTQMARAVKLPPKARPVRKGDEIVVDHNSTRIFMALHDGYVVYMCPDDHEAFSFERNACTWTHADGAEIDWEASE